MSELQVIEPWAGVLLALLILIAAPPLEAIDSAAARSLFANPPRAYSTSPLWVWNDEVTDERIVQTMEALAAQNVRQVFVHPRPGLITPYLSDEWFRLWGVALAEARRLDMNVWIYDENSYPSGFAGGHVPAVMPEAREKELVPREAKRPGSWTDRHVAVFRMTDDGYEDVTPRARGGDELPEGRYLEFQLEPVPAGPWFGNYYYVDLLMPGVTEEFLDITLTPYHRAFADEFGGRIPGVFTDEPNIRLRQGYPWTGRLPELFEKRWGYALTDHLPCLVHDIGDYKRVRHNYVQLLSELFIEHWSRPYHDYCEANQLEFTGHYWEHDWPWCLRVPDNMAMYAWHQRPAIDCLMNEYEEHPRAQFGNARAVRELASVANQLGRQRTLCEAYGAGGWDLRFEDMKRIGDWLCVLGVNTLDEHLSYMTIVGARKRDHPQSFSYHEPWWDRYHACASYFTRLCAAISQGEQVNEVLVLEPTTTAWMYNTLDTNHAPLMRLGNAFQDLVLQLELNQVEYDIGCEDILARHGSADTGRLVVGERAYHTVVIPPWTENLNAATVDLLERSVRNGAAILCCGEPPGLVEGRPSDRLTELAVHKGWQQIDAADLPADLLARGDDGFALRPDANRPGKLFHQRRRLDDGELLLVVNTSIDEAAAGTIESAARGIERWDLETGGVEPYAFESTGRGVRARFELAPCGSLLLRLSRKPLEPAAATAAGPPHVIAPTGDIEIRRLEPNVLTLDYVDVTAGDESRQNAYFYPAGQLVFKANGMERNPWDSGVQFRDEIITRTFPADSGFEAVYRFTIRDQVPAPLSIVIERAERYTITCNGRPVAATEGAWWLDRAFGRIDIADAARVGENEVRIKASPMTVYHELESAYVIGDFALEAADAGFVIVPPQAMQLGPWNGQGMPFYAGGVAYVRRFGVSSPTGRYVVSLPAWLGSVADVRVNGKPAGHIWHQPWTCDVTKHLTAGDNTIEVVVVGTLKNTLGPHHGNPPLGRAWPAMFHQGPEVGPPPGDRYDTVGYGLFEPFTLETR